MINRDNPHFKYNERSWQSIKRGIKLCLESAETMRKVLDYCKRRDDFGIWAELLADLKSGAGRFSEHTVNLSCEHFLDLSDDEIGFWQIVQNHPFAVLFAQEKYEELKRKRKPHDL